MEALDLHRTETAKLSEHQKNCRLLGKDVRSVFLILLLLLLVVYSMPVTYLNMSTIVASSILSKKLIL